MGTAVTVNGFRVFRKIEPDRGGGGRFRLPAPEIFDGRPGKARGLQSPVSQAQCVENDAAWIIWPMVITGIKFADGIKVANNQDVAWLKTEASNLTLTPGAAKPRNGPAPTKFRMHAGGTMNNRSFPSGHWKTMAFEQLSALVWGGPILISLAVIVSIIAALPAHAGGWRVYNNQRYGTTADVPTQGFNAEPPAQNGDGRTWVSDDGRGQVLVFGDLIVTADTVTAYRRETLGYARSDGVDIVYSAAKKNWFAYSGFLGSDIVYEKVVVTTGCDPMIGNHVYFRYPASQKGRYDAIVRHMAASLDGDRNAPMCN